MDSKSRLSKHPGRTFFVATRHGYLLSHLRQVHLARRRDAQLDSNEILVPIINLVKEVHIPIDEQNNAQFRNPNMSSRIASAS